jgi:hypothetical protein
MTLSYAPHADGHPNYPQARPMKILWTDARMEDPCVNLYLVRDNRMGGRRLSSAVKGHAGNRLPETREQRLYTWTVSSKYSGIRDDYSLTSLAAGTPTLR